MPAGYPKPYTPSQPLSPYQVEAMQQAVQRIKDKLREDDQDNTVERDDG